jgi:2-C-methyl-D-erythritol 4-phosphate cytidylyltransferase
VPLAGRPLLEWSLAALADCEAVAAVIVAVPPGTGASPATAGVRVVEGGATRAQSVANALAGVETELVAIHDAARPLLTPALLEAVVATLTADPEADAAIAAAPITDTVKRSRPIESTVEGDATGLGVEATLDRSVLWGAQTPQVFRTAALREALAVDERVRDAATDEAMLVEAAGGRVLLHPVEAPNLKVTTPLDLRVAELLLSADGPQTWA